MRGPRGSRGLGSSGTIARGSCNRNGVVVGSGQRRARQRRARQPRASLPRSAAFACDDTAPRRATVPCPFSRLNARWSYGKATARRMNLQFMIWRWQPRGCAAPSSGSFGVQESSCMQVERLPSVCLTSLRLFSYEIPGSRLLVCAIRATQQGSSEGELRHS